MIPHGGGLNHFPPGKEERDLREAREEQIKQARRHRERVTYQGRRYWLLRLPDASGFDYTEQDGEAV